MPNFIESFFSKLKHMSSPSHSDENKNIQGIKKIVDQLSHMDPSESRFLACFAFLLFRVAYADMDISSDEESKVEEILQTWGQLPHDQAAIIAQIAKAQNLLFGNIDNFVVAKEFKSIASLEQKKGLLRSLFAVAASDDSISSLESDTIRMIADELGMERPQYTEIRRQFADKLAVLKS